MDLVEVAINTDFCGIFDLYHFGPMKLWKEFISNWCEVG